MQLLARTEGIFAETAGGVTIATLKKLAADGVVRPDERVVVYITGHGLKTLDAVVDHGRPDRDDRAAPRRLPRRVRHRATSAGARRHAWQSPSASPRSCASSPAARPRSTVEAATVADVLKALDAAHPGFAERLFDDEGELRRFVNVFVADEDIRFLDGVDTAVADGQTVSIVPAVAGG